MAAVVARLGAAVQGACVPQLTGPAPTCPDQGGCCGGIGPRCVEVV